MDTHAAPLVGHVELTPTAEKTFCSIERLPYFSRVIVTTTISFGYPKEGRSGRVRRVYLRLMNLNTKIQLNFAKPLVYYPGNFLRSYVVHGYIALS